MRCAALLFVFAVACSADAVPEPSPTVKTPGAIFASLQQDETYTLAQMLAELPVTDTEFAYFVKTFHNRAPSLEEARRICREEPLLIRTDATFVADTVLESAEVVWFVTLTEEDLDPIR